MDSWRLRGRWYPVFAGCAAPRSAAARARAPVRGGAVRGHVRGSALWEWSRGGGRGEQRRGRGGARTPSSPGLLEAVVLLYPQPQNPGLWGRWGTPAAEPGRWEERRGAVCSFAFLARFRKWVGLVLPASEVLERESKEKEFTCVWRQRVGLKGSSGGLSLSAQWAVRWAPRTRRRWSGVKWSTGISARMARRRRVRSSCCFSVWPAGSDAGAGGGVPGGPGIKLMWWARRPAGVATGP